MEDPISTSRVPSLQSIVTRQITGALREHPLFDNEDYESVFFEDDPGTTLVHALFVEGRLPNIRQHNVVHGVYPVRMVPPDFSQLFDPKMQYHGHVPNGKIYVSGKSPLEVTGFGEMNVIYFTYIDANFPDVYIVFQCLSSAIRDDMQEYHDQNGDSIFPNPMMSHRFDTYSDVMGGRFPIPVTGTHFYVRRIICSTMLEYLMDYRDWDRRGLEFIFHQETHVVSFRDTLSMIKASHIIRGKPSGQLRFHSVGIHPVTRKKKMVFRFDDEYQLDCWLLFAIDYDDVMDLL